VTLGQISEKLIIHKLKHSHTILKFWFNCARL